MALFTRKRFVWNEPWFFQQRIRTTQSWINLILLLIVVFVGTAALFYFSAPNGQPKNWLEIIGMGFATTAAVWWIVDGVETRRQAVLFEDSIIVGGDMGKYSAPETFKLSEIEAAAIVLPEESKWPEPALFFHYDGEEQCIGIEKKVGLERVAQAVHDAGIPIRLDGWEPDQESAFEKRYEWQSDIAEVAKRATMTELPEGTPGIMNAPGILMAIYRQCWALGLWLLLTGYLGYYSYLNWGNLGLIRVMLLIAVPIAVLYVAGTYTDRVATAATSFGLMRMALDQMRKRSGVQIDLDSEDLIPIEILEPDQITNTIQQIYEMGYIQVSKESKSLRYEGKKQRWEIPAEAIRELRMDEVQAGTPGQSATGTLNYYVMIRFQSEEEMEFAIRYGQRDFGEFNDMKRAEGAIIVFEAIETLVK